MTTSERTQIAYVAACNVCRKRRRLYLTRYVMFGRDLGWQMCRKCAKTNSVWEGATPMMVFAPTKQEASP